MAELAKNSHQHMAGRKRTKTIARIREIAITEHITKHITKVKRGRRTIEETLESSTASNVDQHC